MENKIFWIVEWFFSIPLNPWNYNQRIKTLEYIWQECSGINSYLFCPKDDIYVTKEPYVLYPNEKLEEFKSYIDVCEKNKIQFIYWLNPILWEKELLAKEETIKNILNRFKQLQNVWCKSFCLLFDDISIAYDVFDNDKKIDTTIFQNIIDIVNTVYNWVKLNCKTFLFCSPDYCFKDKTQFTDVLWKLDSAIYIFWTWNNIFTKNISKNNLNKTLDILWNKKIAIWKNYPVNDLQQNIWMYNLWWYPVFDIEKENNNIPIFINPMREFGVNFAFFKTFSEYIENPVNYDSEESINNAISNLLWIDSKTANIMRSFWQFDIYDCDYKIENILSLVKWENIVKILENIKIDNDWWYWFWESIKFIIEQIKYFYTIIEKINKNQKCDEIVKKYDIFPTISTNPRYFIEIYKIIKRRSWLGYFTEKWLLELMSFDINEEIFKSKYSGSVWLGLINEYKDKYLDLNKNIIELDKIELINYLKNENISNEKKIETFVKRFFINRFFIWEFD